MVATFADASAVVKLYATEAGTAAVRRHRGPLVLSALTRVEVPSAFWMKHRMRLLSAADARLLSAGFEHDLASGALRSTAAVAEVSVTGPILDRAARHCAVHGLKAADAVQLASAEAVRAIDPTCRDFLVFDQRLSAAAAAEGFSVSS